MYQSESDDSKYRIALWTPLPPTKSGIADYVAELLPYLKNKFELEIFVDTDYEVEATLQEQYQIFQYRMYEQRQSEHEFDLNIYQMGNNVFHLYIYEQALRVPGLVVFHDFSMSSVLYHYYAGVFQDIELFKKEFTYSEGIDALSKFQSFYDVGDQQGLMELFGSQRMLRRLVERNLAFVTHLPYTTEILKSDYQVQHATSMFLGSPDPYDELTTTDTAILRKKLDIAPNDIIIGVFGHIQRTKQISVTLKALARLKASYPNLKLILVGEVNPAQGYNVYLQNLIDQLGLKDILTITGFVSKTELLEYMLVADVHVSLRYPSFGQMSATLSRGIASGKPLIITDLPEWRFFPEDFCWRVSPEDTEGEQLEKYLEELLDNPETIEQRGNNARTYFQDEGTTQIAAKNLGKVATQIVTHYEEYNIQDSELPLPEQKTQSQQLQTAYNDYMNYRSAGLRNHFGQRIKKVPILGKLLFGLYHFYSLLKHYNALYESELRFHRLLSENLTRNVNSIASVDRDILRVQSEIGDLNIKLIQPFELPAVKTIENPLEDQWDTATNLMVEKFGSDRPDIEQNEDASYIRFEHIFRGDSSIIKERQRQVLNKLDISEMTKPIVDIGCGSGEFLSLLRENDIQAIGVETNKLHFENLKSEGYQVYLADAVTYLENLEANSLGGITAFHVAEHLDPQYLMAFLDFAYKKLAPDGFIYLETPNPYNFESLSAFYTDFTHYRPLQPFQLSYLVREANFSDLQILFLQPTQPRGTLAEENWMRLYRDYGVIGHKRD